MPDDDAATRTGRAMDRAAHRAALAAAAGADGSLRPAGDAHLILRRPGRGAGAATLLVGFGTLAAARARPAGLPFTTALGRDRGWATLDVLADGRTWFRCDALHDAFDGWTDDGTFDGFDRVIFAGGGMGAYGAAAHSVAAPGAVVVAVQPYATLARDVAPWERRFRASWSLPFGPRYGDASRMIDAAARVYVVTDPTEAGDAMHASLFTGDHVQRLAAAHAGGDVMARLAAAGILDRVIAAAADGTLTPLRFAQAWRARRQEAGWIGNVMRAVDRMDRPALMARVAGHALRQTGGDGARRRLNAALAQLAAEGRSLPARPQAAPPVPPGRPAPTRRAGE